MRQSSDDTRSNYSMKIIEQGEEICVINGFNKGNIARFINHGCSERANMKPELIRILHSIPRVTLWSLRDILPGEELLFEYKTKTQKEKTCPQMRKIDEIY
jgi:SET domain-containing protein